MPTVITGGGGVLGYMDGVGRAGAVLRSDGTSSTTSCTCEAGQYTGEYEAFCAAVLQLLSDTASQKSYNRTGTDGPNPLYEFVRDMSGSDAHALGEIVYKAKRFSAKHDIEDVLKIAAWAFLIWKYRRQEPIV